MEEQGLDFERLHGTVYGVFRHDYVVLTGRAEVGRVALFDTLDGSGCCLGHDE